MKHLMIFKAEPDKVTAFLAEKLAEGKQVTRFDLYDNRDYAKLVELIFDSDEVISWW